MQKNCVINYKQWKTSIAEDPTATRLEWMQRLTKECKRIDNVLYRHPSSHHVLRDILMCFCQGDRVATAHLSPTECFDLSILNTTILFKLCKKLQKKLKVPAMAWYSAVLARHTYHFTGSANRTRMEMLAHECFRFECPICLDDVEFARSAHAKAISGIILGCGHAFCMQCIERHWNLATITSPSIYVRLNIASGCQKCPICQLRDPASGAILLH